MVIKYCCIKKINFSFKKTLFLAITLCVIANFIYGNIVFAKNIAEINNKDVEKIKTGLDLVKAVVNFTVMDDRLKTILNTAISVGDTSTDITYGLLVLTTLNEMELIDLVVSQRYKTQAREYFNSVLDERLNLMNYYTGIGYDLPRIISGNITGPVSALTLNAFSMTNKTIDIFIALENIKTVKSYNGLWLYFDLKKNNESHKTAWEEAKIIMGWAAEPTSFYRNVKRNDIKSQLESQFATLYEKWGPYVTINKGVNEQYKKQVQKELQNTVVVAYENYRFIEKQPSFAERTRLSLNNLLEKVNLIGIFLANTGKKIQKTAQIQLSKINSEIQKLTAFISNFGPGIAVKVEEVSEQSIESEIKNIEEKTSLDKLSLSQEDELSVVLETQELLQTGGPEPNLDKLSLSKEEIQEIIDDIYERVDVLAQEIKELTGEEDRVEEELEPEKREKEKALVQDEKQEPSENIVYYSSGTSYSPPSPTFLKILITEIQIASENNKKDDFVELYNPNSEDIDLTNWYLQRKTKSGADFSTYAPKSLFSAKIIRAHDYFLIANASSTFSADVITTYPLTEDNTLVLKNPNREIFDKVGWGQAQDFETAPVENPLANQSIGRKWSTTTEDYIDSDNNHQDFEIQEPTPKKKNKSKVILEPGEIKQIPPLTLVINEVAWMGTQANSADEWIELYNTTSTEIDLNNWTLTWSHGTTTYSIIFSTSTTATTTISSNGFYLIERTDDDAISDISADWTGSFGYGLNNQGEKLELKDDNGNLIDVVDCSSGWFAGENQKIGNNWLRASMERISSTSTGATSTDWMSNNLIMKNGKDANSNDIYGTPKTINSASMSFTLISDLPFSTTTPEITLSYNHNPYLTTQNLLIPKDKTLFIEEGVIIKFCQDCELVVEGIIQTSATSSKDIIFTSYKDDDYSGDTNGDGESKGEAGDWRRIYFKNSTGSELNNIIIKYAGQLSPTSPPFTDESYLPIIHIEKGNVSVKNATISDSLIRGIWLNNSTSTISNIVVSNIKNSPTTRDSAGVFITGGNSVIENSIFLNNSIGIEIKSGNPQIENNTFKNNEIPIYLFSSASPDFSNNHQNTYNNILNGILVAPTDISATSTWQADLPYVIDSQISISQEASLILKPGVILKFKDKILMQINGKLIAQGVSTTEVIFTSINDDYGGDTNNNGSSTVPSPADWRALRFYSSGSILDNAIIRYGGSTFKWTIGAVAVEENVDISIQNSVFENNRLATSYENINCTTTEQIINDLKTTHNVIFRNNDYDFKPICSIP